MTHTHESGMGGGGTPGKGIKKIFNKVKRWRKKEYMALIFILLQKMSLLKKLRRHICRSDIT